MYDKETLSAINVRFLREHRILSSDIEMANRWVQIIEESRSPDRPVIGDIVRLTTKHGSYYHCAHIDTIDGEGNASVCEQPYIPFIFTSQKPIGFCFSTSGGAWECCDTSRMKLVGQELKCFCHWGNCGMCKDGAVAFEATVNVWEYTDPAPRFGEYTTRDWAQRYVSLRKKEDEYGYRYIVTSSGAIADTAFRSEDEYKAWLLTYKAVEFKGYWPNQFVVFLYKKEEHLISEAEWESLPLPTDTRAMNASILTIKYQYDDEAHIIHEYRFDNQGYLGKNQYWVAMERIKAKGYKRVILPPVND